MLAKVLTIAVFAFVGTSVDALNWNGLTSRWAPNPQNGHYPLPLNVDDAKTQSWTELNGADSSGEYTVLRYKGDARCALYFCKKTGLVRGVQVSVPVEDISGKGIPINYENFTGLHKKTFDNVNYYSSSIMFFRLDGNDDDGPRIWMRDQEGRRQVIPTDTNVLNQNTLYKKKGCLKTMGTHYFRVSYSRDCVDVYPWSFLGDGPDVIGFTFQLLGPATKSTDREWFEVIPLEEVTRAVSDPPQCLVQEITDFNVTSLHFWLLNNVSIFSCN